MQKHISFIFLSLSLLTFSFYAAAMGRAPVDHAEKSQQASKPTHKTYSKPHAPVNMRYVFANEKLQVNQTVDLEITLTNTQDADSLHVDIHADKALHAEMQAVGYSFLKLPKNEKSVVRVSVTASEEGFFYLYVNTRVAYKGNQQGRSFVIPVRIGETAASFKPSFERTPPEAMNTDSTGRKIISMPASMD